MQFVKIEAAAYFVGKIPLVTFRKKIISEQMIMEYGLQ